MLGRDVEVALESYTSARRDVVAVVKLRRAFESEEYNEEQSFEEELALVYRGMTSSITHFTHADVESSVFGDSEVLEISLAEAPYHPTETKFIKKNVVLEELLEEIGMETNRED